MSRPRRSPFDLIRIDEKTQLAGWGSCCGPCNGELDGNGVLDGCSLDGLLGSFTVIDGWGSGFPTELEIVKYGKEEIPAGWIMEFSRRFELNNLWATDYQVGTNGTVTVFAPEWSQPVSTGESIVIGMQEIYSGSIEEPIEVILNGSSVQLD